MNETPRLVVAAVLCRVARSSGRDFYKGDAMHDVDNWIETQKIIAALPRLERLAKRKGTSFNREVLTFLEQLEQKPKAAKASARIKGAAK